MNNSIPSKVKNLGDLGLAILVCLISQQHCLFSTTQNASRDLQEELRLICTSVFGLRPAVIECSANTTIDEFNECILVDDNEGHGTYDRPTLSVNFSSLKSQNPGRLNSMGNKLDERRIADVIIATDLDLATESIQVQALELIRTKRIFTRTSMHTASKDFMVLAVASKPGARLSHHLNDLFCMSHYHAEDDGLPYLHRELSKDHVPTFSVADIKDLRTQAEESLLSPELAAYLHNIVVFMRNSRYIKGGVTATGSRQLRIITKTLAPLHGLNYVPPSLVTLAVRKIYPHRLILATAETERSLQWGSDAGAIDRILHDFSVEDAIEDVLAAVETPL